MSSEWYPDWYPLVWLEASDMTDSLLLLGTSVLQKTTRNRAERAVERAVFWRAGGPLQMAAAFHHNNNRRKRLYLDLASSLFKHAFDYKERPFHMP